MRRWGGGGSSSARSRYAAALSAAPRRRAAAAASTSTSTTHSSARRGHARSWAATSSAGARASVSSSCRRGVAELPLARGQVVVDGVAHERMHEAERRIAAQDLGPRQRRARRGDRRLVEPRERGDERQLGAVAEHRHGSSHRGRLLGEAVQAQQHGARDRARPDLAHRPRLASAGRHAVGLERAEELAQQQRVAAGPGQAGGGEGRIGLGAQAQADELRHARIAERAGMQAQRGWGVGELADEHRIGAALGRAQTEREQPARALQAAREVGEEAQRRPVAPVQVVHARAAAAARR